jgi:hypothetical protein
VDLSEEELAAELKSKLKSSFLNSIKEAAVKEV